MVELFDLEFVEYSINDFEGKLATIYPKNVQTKGSASKYDLSVIAEFEDSTALISMTPTAILGKCTCMMYGKEPCEHLVSAFQVLREKAGKKLDKLEGSKEEMEDRAGDERAETKTELKSKFYGKLTVLFGQPMTGKTTFAMQLAKDFKNPVIIKVDRNYRVEDYGINAKVHNVATPKDVLESVMKTPAYDDTIVIVDSITSLDAYFMPDDPTKDDPRVANRRARFCDSVMLHLQKFKSHGAVVVIAHESIKDFRTGEVGPRMNAIALRHADQVLHLTVENGKRKIRAVNVRKVVENPEFVLEGL